MKPLFSLFLLLACVVAVSPFDVRYVAPLLIMGKAEAQGFLGILGSLMGGGNAGGGLGSLLGGGGLLGGQGGGGLLGGLLPNQGNSRGGWSSQGDYDDYSGGRLRRGRYRGNRYDGDYASY